MRRTDLYFTVVVLAGAVALGACGRGSGRLPEAAAGRLRPQVEAVRAAAAAGDRAGAQAGLDSLRRTVAELRQAGAMSQGEAGDVLDAAAGVEAQLGQLPAPAPPATTATIAPPAPPEQPVIIQWGHREKKHGDNQKE